MKPIESNKQVWERRSSESPKAFRAFMVFLSLGLTRTFGDTAKAIEHKSVASVKRWGRSHDWQERACAYDLQAVERTLEDTEALRVAVDAKRIKARLETQNTALDLTPDALDALAQIIRDRRASAIARVQAAEVVFKHAGVLAPEEAKEGDATLDETALFTWLVSLFEKFDRPEDRAQFKALAMQALTEETLH